jgi:hypothetical protein
MFMKREDRCTGPQRMIVVAIALAAISGPVSMGIAFAGPPADIKALVTRWSVSGIPYADAKAVGPQAIPELAKMLKDPELEAHWTKVVWVLGCIGDSAATAALTDFLERPQGEVSVDTFRAALAVLPSLGHLARGGDAAAFQTLKGYASVGSPWPTRRPMVAGLGFSYGRYKGDALAEVLGRMAVQGLGIAGTPEALAVLESMNTGKLRPDWRDNVEEAIALNLRVAELGPDRAFAEEVGQ